MAYTNEAAIENYLLKDIDPSFSSQIISWIASVTDFINNYTGRNFEAGDTASAKLFSGNGSQKLLIDDCIEIDTVEIGDTYGDSFEETTEYVALPLNDTPKNCIALKNRAWPVGIHQITAKWGYSVSVPDDIALAATILVAAIINTQTKTGTAIKSEKIGNYAVTYSDEREVTEHARAMAILDSYKRFTI